jgi:transglutaminase-like putative cysteine protease
MPKIYRYLTAVLAVTGSVGLLVTGEINPLMAAGGIAIFPGYYRFLRGRAAAPGWVVGTASLLTLAVFFFDSFVSGDVFLAVAHLTITFQAIKSYDLKEPWDYLQVYFVSLLQMVIASEMSQSVVFGVLFVFFLLTLVAAMVFAHFVKEGEEARVGLGKPVALISILSLVATSLIFVSLPRTSHRFFGKSHTKGIKITGFSDKVDFGSFGEIKLDPTVIMRVEVDGGPSSAYYWRGNSLDYFDGMKWINTAPERKRIARAGDEYLLAPYESAAVIEQKIFLEPIDSDVIFGLAEIRAVKVDQFRAERDAAGSVSLAHKSSRRVNYSVYSIMRERYSGAADSRYLQLPPGTGKVRELSESVTLGARTDEEKAVRIERYLKTRYAYSLTPPASRGGKGPVEEFLFNSKRGYCEHFATSMVLMLRAIGIPARVVNGYYGGERNAYGGYIIVRQSDAHSWVEALINEMWTRFDPTPSVARAPIPSVILFLDSLRMSWARYVVGFKSDDQKAILRSFYSLFTFPATLPSVTVEMHTRWLLISFIIATAGLIVYMRRKTRVGRYGFVSNKYIELRKLLKGRVEAAETTPRELLRISAGSGLEKEVGEFLRLYEEERFGRRAMGAAERRRYALLLSEIKTRLKRRPA